MGMDAEFEESKHPRDNDGKFGSGGGGKSAWSSAERMNKIPGAINVYKMRPSEMPMTGEELHKAKEAGKGKEKVVNVADLIPTQVHLNQEKVEEYKEGEEGDHEAPDVVEKSGKLYLYDGHHRIAAQAQKGKTKVKVTVFKAPKR
jgi:uncharacterized ParB-like nuclease family protein